jgi:hypothetical protein
MFGVNDDFPSLGMIAIGADRRMVLLPSTSQG